MNTKPDTSTDTKQFEHTVEGARAARDDGELAAWIGDFLRSPGSDNAVLGDELESSGRVWDGPVELPFDELHRLAGPPDQPTLGEFDDGDDNERVEEMEESIEDEDWEPAPLIVTIDDEGQYRVEDGNHRIEGLRRAGRDRYWAVVGFADQAERDRFLSDRR